MALCSCEPAWLLASQTRPRSPGRPTSGSSLPQGGPRHLSSEALQDGGVGQLVRPEDGPRLASCRDASSSAAACRRQLVQRSSGHLACAAACWLPPVRRRHGCRAGRHPCPAVAGSRLAAGRARRRRSLPPAVRATAEAAWPLRCQRVVSAAAVPGTGGPPCSRPCPAGAWHTLLCRRPAQGLLIGASFCHALHRLPAVRACRDLPDAASPAAAQANPDAISSTGRTTLNSMPFPMGGGRRR